MLYLHYVHSWSHAFKILLLRPRTPHQTYDGVLLRASFFNLLCIHTHILSCACTAETTIATSAASAAVESSVPDIQVVLVTCECTYVRGALQNALERRGTKQLHQIESTEDMKSVCFMSKKEVSCSDL
jgi:hypothetical protein